ncbi:hypothetical protein N7G274_007657 [Stereocaulon virgatum]|uniref:ABM domain-containing protein n=1 Tax=Stereocaulon virgatum TaxID=373712 RepID=A0ABR4A420_9LECA
MNFSFSKGPSGPLYSVVQLQYFPNSASQDEGQKEKIWADCLAEISKDPAWSFTLQGQFHEDDSTDKVLMIISWKGTTNTVIPSWTSTPHDASKSTLSSPLMPLLPLLNSQPQTFNVAFRPLLSSVISHPTAITDITTLYIPTSLSENPQIASFNDRLQSFNNEAAHVSHESPGPMISSNRGWGVGEVEREGQKIVVHVVLHTWGSKEEERNYKNGKDGRYETLFLGPLREAKRLGVEWETVQVVLEPAKAEKGGEGRSKEREKGGCHAMQTRS